MILSLMIIVLGQSCQAARIGQSREAMARGMAHLERGRTTGWRALVGDSPDLSRLQRRRGRILTIRPLALAEMVDRPDGLHFDALYRVTCEHGDVDIDLCLVRGGGGWSRHLLIVHDDLGDP